MRVEDLSLALMIHALEEADNEGDVIPFEERRIADEALEGEDVGSPSEGVLARMRHLAPLLRRRAPLLWGVATRGVRLSSSTCWILIGVSALCGWSVQSLGGAVSVIGEGGVIGARFHVLSPPLLGLIMWNLISVTLLIFASRSAGSRVRRDAGIPELESRDLQLQLNSQRGGTPRSVRSPSEPATRASRSLIARALLSLVTRARLYSLQRLLSQQPNPTAQRDALMCYLERAHDQFASLIMSEITRMLHLCAAVFALGVLGGAYWSGIIEAYHATAESTFLGADVVHAILSIVLAPSTLLWRDLPSLELVSDNGGGRSIGPAAAWVHHYALSVWVWVITPRLLLTLNALRTSARLSASVPARLGWLEGVPTLNIALAAHTNVGKTSLARTLLRRDVGEVRDAEHVTRQRASYFLVNHKEVRLRLWDTPGFGDQGPLSIFTKRCQAYQEAHPDAHALRALITQERNTNALSKLDLEALSALADEADLILYLVPAYPSSEQRAQTQVEWSLLAHLGVPVIVMINRVGEGEPDALISDNVREGEGRKETDKTTDIDYKERAQRSQALWRDELKQIPNHPSRHRIYVLDAFQRTYQDERGFYELLGELLPPHEQEIAERALRVWEKSQSEVRERIALSLARTLREVATLHISVTSSKRAELTRAEEELRRAVDMIVSQARDRILDHLGITGEERAETLSFALSLTIADQQRQGRRKLGAIWGGLLSGLMSGITADVMAGGLTLGGGLIVGGVLGALGGAGIAEGIGYIQQSERDVLVSDDALKLLLDQLLTFILCASAHGRARGVFSSVAMSDLVTRCGRVIQELNRHHASTLEQRLKALRGERGVIVEAELEALEALLTRVVSQGLSAL